MAPAYLATLLLLPSLAGGERASAQSDAGTTQDPFQETDAKPASTPDPLLGAIRTPPRASAPEEAKVLEVERRFHEQDSYWSISYEGITGFLATDDLLDILSSSGDVCIEPSPAQQNPAADHVRVRVEIRALKDEVSREEVVRNLTDHVLFVRDGNTLCIKDRHADDEDFDSWRVCITVQVPRAIGAEVKTRTGDIRIRRVSGDLSLQSTSGDLSIQAKKSELQNVKLSSAAGSIHLSAGVVAGSMDVSTSAGGVTLDVDDPSRMKSAVVRSLTGSLCLTLPKKTPGSFRLQSEDGNLSLSSCKDFQIRKDVSGETAIGRLGKGGPDFDLLSTTGSISLQMK